MQVYEEITPQEMEAQETEALHRTAAKKEISVVAVQAIIALLVLVAAFVLKYMLPEMYNELRSQYDAEMARTVWITYDDVSVV